MSFRVIGMGRAYLHRLIDWWHVAREVTGDSLADRRVLRRALIRAPVDSLRRLDVWREPRVSSDIRVSSALGRFDVRADSEELYLATPSRERAVMKAIRSILRSGDVFVDAGANIGVYTVFASKLCQRVIAVEMIPETTQILRRHVALNNCRNVTVVEAALSDRAGETVRASVVPGEYGKARLSESGEVEVQTSTLAGVLADIPRIRLIKLDIEGAELTALRGLGNANVEHIIFEDWTGSEVADFLSSRGYSIKRLDPDNSLAVRSFPR